MKTGDDRALTIYCKEKGRAEFQPLAVGYTALPVTLSHLVRQRVRWARSWYWGSAWLLRRRIAPADFILTFLQACGMVMYFLSIVFAVVGVAVGAIAPRLLFWTVVTSIVIGMVSTMRYVVAARPEDPWISRLVTWLLSPLSSLLYMFLLVPIYWYAALTMRAMGWGTRRTIEVGLHKPATQPKDKRVIKLDPATSKSSRPASVVVLGSKEASSSEPANSEAGSPYQDVAHGGRQ